MMGGERFSVVSIFWSQNCLVVQPSPDFAQPAKELAASIPASEAAYAVSVKGTAIYEYKNVKQK